MPGKAKSKHDRCVEKVKQQNPSVENPHAVCVAAGVRPASWKKSHDECDEVMKMSNLGQWKIEKADKKKEKDEGYMGFDKLKQKLAHKKGVEDPGALAAAIGRKKYGKDQFQSYAAKGKKLAKADSSNKASHLMALDKLHGLLKELQRNSILGTNPQKNSDIEKVKNKIVELQYKAGLRKEDSTPNMHQKLREVFKNPPLKLKEHVENLIKPYKEKIAEVKAARSKDEQVQKDDKPHPPGSPEDEAHDVVEFDKKLRDEMKDLSPEGKRKMLEHLRTLKDKSEWRSYKNQKAGDEKDEPGLD